MTDAELRNYMNRRNAFYTKVIIYGLAIGGFIHLLLYVAA